jgi:ribosomal protein L22
MPAFTGEIRRSRYRAATGCVITAALALVLAGCGSQGDIEEMLLPDALDTTFDETETLKATVEMPKQGTSVIRSGVVDGEPECEMRSINRLVVAHIVVNDSGAYVRANQEAYRWRSRGQATREQLATVAHRWIKRPRTEADQIRESMCDVRAQLTEDPLTSENLDQVEKQAGTLNGEKTIKLTFTGGPSTLDVHIAAEGRPYLLKVAERGGTVWTFGDFDKPFRAKTPAEPIDEEDMAGRIAGLAP